MGITIITDSGSDIKQETAGKWGVRVLPLMVRFGDEEFLDDVTLTADQMYERMIRTGELPRTGQVPPYIFELAFRDEVRKGNTVICITNDLWTYLTIPITVELPPTPHLNHVAFDFLNSLI